MNLRSDLDQLQVFRLVCSISSRNCLLSSLLLPTPATADELGTNLSSQKRLGWLPLPFPTIPLQTGLSSCPCQNLRLESSIDPWAPPVLLTNSGFAGDSGSLPILWEQGAVSDIVCGGLTHTVSVSPLLSFHLIFYQNRKKKKKIITNLLPDPQQ